MRDRIQRISLRIIGLLGALVFGTFVYFSFSTPEWVENFAAEYIEGEARKRVESSIDDIAPPESESALGRLADGLYERNEARIEELKTRLRDRVHEQWAAAIAAIRDLDCECRRKHEELFEQSFIAEIGLLDAANEQIESFVHGKYMVVSAELRRDIRIFAGSNLGVFVLLLFTSFLKPRATTHLFLPGILLFASTLICTYFYLFEQNWLMTIIHSSYLGFAYLAWLAAVFLLLCDIVFNRGRVTSWIINQILSAVGSAASVVPC